MMTILLSVVSTLVLATTGASGDGPRCNGDSITLQCRFEAQTAIEKVYFRHTLETRESFEQTVSTAVIDQKVRRYVQKSIALEDVWETPITREMLHAELARIARETRMPERLLEIYEALNHDYGLVLECFVRPILAERLADQWLAQEDRVPDLVSSEALSSGEDVEPETSGPRRMSWEEWWGVHGHDLEESSFQAVAPGPGVLPVPAQVADCPVNDTWDNGSLAEVPEEQGGHASVWTGTLMLSWGGFGVPGTQLRGFRYDPITNTWGRMSAVNSPLIRARSKAVWTGTRMVVWGGDLGTTFNTGGRYDPVLDVWSPTSTVGAPSGRSDHSVVWTGSEMIVWGGGNSTGAAYDPASDSWRPIAPAPEARLAHTAVWTGREMIVWGGSASNTVPLPKV